MLSSGFFNSVSADRPYNAESFNTFFEGLISKDGIFENVGNKFTVSVGSGLTLNIASGKALVNNCWVRNTAVETITLDAAHSLFSRYDMITLRWDNSTRTVTLEKTTGTPASVPTKPDPIRTSNQYEIVLAYVLVRPNATAISQGNITDCRYDSELCGTVTGLIKQVNIDTLYAQFASQFQALSNQMEEWEQTQQESYNTWFNTLTEDLVVNAGLSRSIANFKTTRADGTQYIDVPTSLGYSTGDILEVYVNGLLLIEGSDYDLTVNEVENVPMIYLYSDVEKDNMITFCRLRLNNAGEPALIEETALPSILEVGKHYKISATSAITLKLPDTANDGDKIVVEYYNAGTASIIASWCTETSTTSNLPILSNNVGTGGNTSCAVGALQKGTCIYSELANKWTIDLEIMTNKSK